MEYKIGSVVLVKIPGNKKPQYRWITERRDDGRFMVRTPIKELSIETIKKGVGFIRDKDYEKPHLLPIGSQYIRTEEEKKKDLFSYVEDNYLKGVIRVLDEGTDINSKKEDKYKDTPLHIAVSSNYLKLVNLLLERGADPNAINGENETPLQMICLLMVDREKKKAIIDTLLHYGADIEVQDKKGNKLLHNLFEEAFPKYPLSEEAAEGYIETILHLIDKGADVNAGDKYGRTLLHKACLKGNEKIIMALMDKGANVNIQSTGGETPFHMACLRNNEKIIMAMIDKGANVNIKNNRGQTYDIYLNDAELQKRIEKRALKVKRQIEYNMRQKNEPRKLANSRIINTLTSNKKLLPENVLSLIAEYVPDDVKNKRTPETVMNVKAGLDDREQIEVSKYFGGNRKTVKRKINSKNKRNKTQSVQR